MAITMKLSTILNSENFDIGMKDYPIFDESHRETLNSKIFEHYRYREIGAETPARFRRYLNNAMNEIMPYYNQLYESELIKYDPLITMLYHECVNTTENKVNSGDNNYNDENIVQNEVIKEDSMKNNQTGYNNENVDTTGKVKNNGTSKQTTTNNLTKNSTGETTSDSNNSSDGEQSDYNALYAQSLINNVDNPNHLSDGSFKKNKGSEKLHNNTTSKNDEKNTGTVITDNTNNDTQDTDSNVISKSDFINEILGSSNGKQNINGNVKNNGVSAFNNILDGNIKTKKKIKGYNGSPSDEINKLRSTFLNIDKMIIEDKEIRECFLMIY